MCTGGRGGREGGRKAGLSITLNLGFSFGKWRCKWPHISRLKIIKKPRKSIERKSKHQKRDSPGNSALIPEPRPHQALLWQGSCDPAKEGSGREPVVFLPEVSSLEVLHSAYSNTLSNVHAYYDIIYCLSHPLECKLHKDRHLSTHFQRLEQCLAYCRHSINFVKWVNECLWFQAIADVIRNGWDILASGSLELVEGMIARSLVSG